MFACSAPRLNLAGASWMVRGLARGPRVDVVKLDAIPWAPVLVANSIFKELVLAVPHSSRNGSVISSRNEWAAPLGAFPKWRKQAQCILLDPLIYID